MNCRLHIFFLLFLSFVKTQAQEQVAVEDKLLGIKASLFAPALEFTYEKKLTNKSVFEGRAGVNFGFSISSSSLSFNDEVLFNSESSSYSISPTLVLSYKNYYNLNKRYKKGKNIENNTANFFGVSLVNYFGGYVSEKYKDIFNNQYSQKDYYNEYIILLSPKWGFNRRLGNKVTYNFELGPTFVTDFKEVGYGLWIQTGFSYILKN